MYVVRSLTWLPSFPEALDFGYSRMFQGVWKLFPFLQSPDQQFPFSLDLRWLMAVWQFLQRKTDIPRHFHIPESARVEVDGIAAPIVGIDEAVSAACREGEVGLLLAIVMAAAMTCRACATGSAAEGALGLLTAVCYSRFDYLGLTGSNRGSLLDYWQRPQPRPWGYGTGSPRLPWPITRQRPHVLLPSDLRHNQRHERPR